MKKIIAAAILFTAGLECGCTKQPVVVDDVVPNTIMTTASTSQLTASGTLTDSNIRYFGRWDFSNASQFVSYWGGAYLKVKFSGTTVKIKVGNTSNFYAKIDNGAWVSYLNVGGTINLTTTPLGAGTHTLSVAQGKDYDYVFNFQGLILDAGAVTSTPPVNNYLVEYIGDSITAGYTDAQAEVSDYAWICSETLGTEHTQIAYPGITLVNGYGANTTKIGMDVQYFKLQSLAYPSSPDWDFSKYTPKLVVINLGQNDAGNPISDATFQNDYYNFLTSIRAKFPDADIFVMRTFSGVKGAPALAAVNERVAAGETKLHFIDTNGWLSSAAGDFNDGVHPSTSGHIKAANLLSSILSPYLSETPLTQPYLDHCDAMTGWSSGNILTLNTTDKKEGISSLQSLGSSIVEFQKAFTPLNSGATPVSGALRFWYYVSDVSQLGTGNQIELGSGGAPDINEYNWDMGPLVNGWNLITKTFASAGVTNGTPNLSSLNWFRIYHSKNASVTTKIDGIQIIH